MTRTSALKALKTVLARIMHLETAYFCLFTSLSCDTWGSVKLPTFNFLGGGIERSRDSGFVFATQAPTSSFTPPNSRNMLGGSRQAKDGHVAINRFEFARFNHVGFMEYAHGTICTN